MAERFVPVDRETLEKNDILLLAPDTFSIVVGIDTRRSRRSLQTVVSLPLAEVIKPCPQMPNVVAENGRLRRSVTLRQVMAEQSEAGQKQLTKLVTFNVINHLNDQRAGIEAEHSRTINSNLLFLPTFTFLAKANGWELIRDTIKSKDEGHLLTNVDAFLKKQVQLEHDPRGYITGENGSTVIWQRHEN